MIVEALVGAFGLFVLAGIYLALGAAGRGPGDCDSCSLKEETTLCGGCGLPDTPPDADPVNDRPPRTLRRRNGPREEHP